MPLQGTYTDQNQDQQTPGAVLLASYNQPGGAGPDSGPISGPGAIAPPPTAAPSGGPGEVLMAQMQPPGAPRGGAPGAPGVPPIDADLTEHLKDPDVREMLGLNLQSGAGGKYMLGNVPVIDQPPQGVTARYDPATVDQQLARFSLLQMPIPPNLTAAKSLADSGIVIGTDNQPYRILSGNQDPKRIAQTRMAEAAPELSTAANAEYQKQVTDPAEMARKDALTAKHLRDTLDALPTSGPLTDFLGKTADLATQLGVPAEVTKVLNLPAPGEVTIADKNSNMLIAQLGHSQFPNRITNADLPFLTSQMAHADNRKEANMYVIDQAIMPSIMRDQARAAALRGQNFTNPQQVTSAVDQWNAAHPPEEFVPKPTAPAAVPGAPSPGTTAAPGAPAAMPSGRIIYNPATRKFEPE
jgi:hypothetical protein